MATKLSRFTQKARAEPHLRYTALMGLVFDSEGLHASFERQDGRKAPGADGITKTDYAMGLEDQISDLSVKRKGVKSCIIRFILLAWTHSPTPSDRIPRCLVPGHEPRCGAKTDL